MNSTLGSVVPLAMFIIVITIIINTDVIRSINDDKTGLEVQSIHICLF